MTQIQIEAEFAKVIEDFSWAKSQWVSLPLNRNQILNVRHGDCDSVLWYGHIFRTISQADYETYDAVLKCSPVGKPLSTVTFFHKNLNKVVNKIDELVKGDAITERLKINL